MGQPLVEVRAKRSSKPSEQSRAVTFGSPPCSAPESVTAAPLQLCDRSLTAGALGIARPGSDSILGCTALQGTPGATLHPNRVTPTNDRICLICAHRASALEPLARVGTQDVPSAQEAGVDGPPRCCHSIIGALTTTQPVVLPGLELTGPPARDLRHAAYRAASTRQPIPAAKWPVSYRGWHGGASTSHTAAAAAHPNSDVIRRPRSGSCSGEMTSLSASQNAS